MSTSESKLVRRQRLRFNISALLIVIAISAILFAWLRDRTQLQKQIDDYARQEQVARDRAVQSAMMAQRMLQQLAAQAEPAVQEGARADRSDDARGTSE